MGRECDAKSNSNAKPDVNAKSDTESGANGNSNTKPDVNAMALSVVMVILCGRKFRKATLK